MMFDQIKQSVAGRAASGAGAPQLNLQNLLSGPGGLATGAAAGSLATLLMGGGKPKKLMKNAVKFGGVALVGGLAYKAYRDWQAKGGAAPNGAPAAAAPSPAEEARFVPQTDNEQAVLGHVMARAMIAATKADGRVTDEERSRILGQLSDLGVAQDEIAFVEREINAPLDIETIVGDASTPERAVEIYAASLLAIDPNGRAERGYLAMLASRLSLDSALVDEIHGNLPTPANDAAA